MNAHWHDEEDGRQQRIDLALWRRMLARAAPYKRSLAGLGINGLLIAAIDVLLPWVTGRLIDEATTGGLGAGLAWYGVAYAALLVVFAWSVWLFIVLAGRVATGVAYDLREAGFERMQALSFSYYDTRSVGWLVSRLTADCTKLSSLMPWLMLDLVWGTCTIGGIVVVMLLLDWQLALIVLTIVPPLAIASWLFQRKLLVSSRHVRRSNALLTASYNECIMGVRTTKTLVREPENLGEFQVLSTDMYRYSMRNALQSAVYLPLVILLGNIGVAAALWRGGYAAGAGGLTLGTLVAFMQYAALLYMPIQELARRFTELQSAQAAAERVQTMLDTEPEIDDSDEVRAAVAANASLPRDPGVAIDGGRERISTIEFRDVDFHYLPDEPVLSAFNLTVREGETIALVGPTGGGKSTIVSLVARFYEPRSGGVFFDGVDARDRSLHWLQSNLGTVLQSPHLFSGTIRENIRYGDLDATDDQVEAAAQLVCADRFIDELSEGYDAEVGEGGGRLSTGQRQLVSLARAVLADPQIFIMDEATSSLDAETERLIQSGIEAVLDNRIAFVIAHRLSTIRRADRILFIEGGRIVEQGNHEALMTARGRYYALYAGQFARESSLEAQR